MALIETCAAMAMLYALLSIVASSMKEVIEAWVQKRKGDFKAALEDLLQSEGAARFLKHPRIRTLTSTVGEPTATDPSHWPSYVDPKDFAAVAADIGKELPGSPIGKVLAWASSAGMDQLEVLQQVYSARMERLSGSFKRNAQKWLVGIGFAVAAMIDADTIHIARALSTDTSARLALVQISTQSVSQEALELSCGVAAGSEPQAKASKLIACIGAQAPDLLGWTSKKVDGLRETSCPVLLWLLATKLLGYLLTAFAISLGAPFWFDLISKVANIRSTSKPVPKT